MDMTVKHITSVEELLRLDLSGRYVLDADLDLGGRDWTPLGSDGAPFCGELDGCGHTISNFRVTKTDDAGNAGIFGVNAGRIMDLTVRSVRVSPSVSDAACVGLLAGRNDGDFWGVRAEGCSVILTCDAPARVVLGGLAGRSTGSFRNVQLDAAIHADCADADVIAAGLVGETDGGLLECAETFGEMHLTGRNVRAALFGGRLHDTVLRACRFSAPMNLQNGELFSDYALEETGCTEFDGCLWRDNRGADRFLPPQALALRRLCCEHMERMGSIAWTPDRTLHFRCSCGAKVHGQVFEAGVTRVGMPYCHKNNSYEQFLDCFRPDGTLQPWLAADGYDVFDLYMGNDCSGAVYWAWSRAGNDLSYRWTENMMPAQNMGVLPVAGYDGHCAMLSADVVAKNTPEVIAEAYANCRTGDAVLNYGRGGHVRMLCRAPAVYRDRAGRISLKRSYLVTHEQGGGLLTERKKVSSWLLHETYTFAQLLRDSYIPITTKTLRDGRREKPHVRLERTGDTLDGCTVRSNYRITSLDAQVLGEAGAPVWSGRYYTAVCTYDEEGHDARPRETVRDVPLTKLRPLLPHAAMRRGARYVCRLTVLIATGERFSLDDAAFVW